MNTTIALSIVIALLLIVIAEQYKAHRILKGNYSALLRTSTRLQRVALDEGGRPPTPKVRKQAGGPQ